MSQLAINLYNFTKLLISGHLEEAMRILREQAHIKHSDGVKTCKRGLSDCVLDKCSLFMSWVAHQNTVACDTMIKVFWGINLAEKHCVKFHEQFSEILFFIQGVPPEKEFIAVELVCAYNYLMSCMYELPITFEDEVKVWQTVSSTLQRAYVSSGGSSLYESLGFVADCDFFIRNINFNALSILTIKLFCCFCFSVSLFASTEKKYDLVIEAIKVLKQGKEVLNHKMSSEWRTKTLDLQLLSVCSGNEIPAVKDLYSFLKAGEKMKDKDYDYVIHHLKKIKFHRWKYDILYLIGTVCYVNEKYEQALELLMDAWDEKSCMKRESIAKFSNLIGCCLFAKHRFEESRQWFECSLTYDSNFTMSLWNLSLAFDKLNLASKAEKVLHELITSSAKTSKHQCYIFDNLSITKSQITCIEATYSLAHHLLVNEEYFSSSSMFDSLISLQQEHQILIKSEFSLFIKPNSESKVCIEAAYAALLSRRFRKCLEMCTKADNLCLPFVSQVFFIDDSNIGRQYNTMDSPDQSSWPFEVLLKLFVVSCLLYHKNKFHIALTGMKRLQFVCANSHANKILPEGHNQKVTAMDVDEPHALSTVDIANSRKRSDSDLENPRKKLKAVTDVGDIPVEDIKLNHRFLEEKILLSLIYNNIAVILIYFGQLQNAKLYLHLAGENNPENIDVLYNCCLLEIKLGNVLSAQRIWAIAKQKLNILNEALSEKSCAPCSFSIDLTQLQEFDSFIENYVDESDVTMDFDVTWE